MTTHILFIVNPNAGPKTVEEFEQTLQEELPREALASGALKVEQYIPEESPDEMRDILRQKLAEGMINVLGVVGGDGTIMEVLPVLVDFPNVRLALISYGTGNLLAANLGIPRDFTNALNVALHGRPRRIDLGRINDRYFALIAGVGVVADIMEHTPRESKKRFGILAYVLHGLKVVWGAKRSRFIITTENAQYKEKGVSVVISNAASFLGPCVPLTPEALPDDGLLDVCIVKSQSNQDYIPTIIEALLHSGNVANLERNLIRFKARRVHIRSSRPLKVEADGTIIGTTPIDIEIVRNRLQVLVPEEEFVPASAMLSVTRQQTLLETLQCYFKLGEAEGQSGLQQPDEKPTVRR